MDFFGITSYGPQNYMNDILKEGYKEPMSEKHVGVLMEKVKQTSTCPPQTSRPDEKEFKIIVDIGNVNGFAYGSFQRFNKMKKKRVLKPVGPMDMYRLPITSSTEYGWWMCDPALANEDWYQPRKRHPQPMAPNTKVLEIVKRNNKYASLF